MEDFLNILLNFRISEAAEFHCFEETFHNKLLTLLIISISK